MSPTTVIDPPRLGALTQYLAAERLRNKFKLSINDRTLRALAAKGEGPPRYVIGGRVYYLEHELDRWAYSQFKIDINFRASELEAA